MRSIISKKKESRENNLQNGFSCVWLIYCVSGDKTEICPTSSENQAQCKTHFTAVEIVKINFIERGTVSSSHRLLESQCLCA